MYESINMFEAMNPRYKIKKPIRLIELFAGIGSQAKALKNIDANFETYKVVEYDSNAIKSYNAIHNTDFVVQDITKINSSDLCIVDTNKYEYIMTYSFPCQDLSLAGSQKGMGKGSSTRSGLLWEVERLLKGCVELPQILLMENVPQVVGKANFKDFREWEIFLEGLGYSNYYQLLNAKNYGIPQNRNRCFMVSILGDYSYSFPQPIKLDKRLKDFLEDEVDEKYYLSDKMIEGMKNTNFESYKLENKLLDKNGIASTIIARFEGTPQCIKDTNTTLARDYKDPKLVLVDIKQNVRIRKNKVDIKGLQKLFKEHKTISNNEIAERLNVPVTTIEHWFRTDSGFAIPNEEKWFELKKLLNIKTNEFDKQITEFEIKENEFESSNRAYHEDGICPTITTIDAPKLIQVAQLDGFESSGRVYGTDGLAPTINTMGGGNREPKIATRLAKTLEKNSIEDGDFIDSYNQIIRKGISGTITTRVSESNNTFVAVPEKTKRGYAEAHVGDGVYIDRPHQKREVVQKGMIQTIKTQPNDIGVVVEELIPFGSYYTWKDKQGNINTQCNRAANENGCALTVACTEPGKVYSNLCVRKLTPKECWRLMGFSDEDFEKASKVNSNSQLYKQAGNSIVVNVLEEIFKMLF